MRGADLINPALPDELLDDVLRCVSAGAACKRDLDACALVCRRWRRLERACRRRAGIAASGARADEVLRLVAERFPALADVSVDERLAVASADGASGSRSRRSIHYIPGTSMLKIFKCAGADGCLLDEFMMHEEEEARSSQRRRSKLRQAAPQFMPASMHARHSYNTQVPKSSQLMHASMYDLHTYDIPFPKLPQFMPNTLLPPRSDSVVMNRIISETNDLTGKLHGLNLDRHQSS